MFPPSLCNGCFPSSVRPLKVQPKMLLGVLWLLCEESPEKPEEKFSHSLCLLTWATPVIFHVGMCDLGLLPTLRQLPSPSGQSHISIVCFLLWLHVLWQSCLSTVRTGDSSQSGCSMHHVLSGDSYGVSCVAKAHLLCGELFMLSNLCSDSLIAIGPRWCCCCHVLASP